jgi:hypothetical protein
MVAAAGLAGLWCTAAIAQNPSTDASAWKAGRVIVNPAVRHDRSAPLSALYAIYKLPPPPHRHRHPPVPQTTQPPPTPPTTIAAAGVAVEQVEEGTRPAATLVASFEGLGDGFHGPQGTEQARNPSDNSLAVGPNDIVQIVNSRTAIFTKKGRQYNETGRTLFGPVLTNTLFAGFGGPCETLISGDAVARYDQLAKRWLIVLPIFRKPEGQPNAPYAMCYAVSAGPDPMGSWYRYQFNRPLFPDYPRPAIWSNGYYLPASTGDTVIQKQLCAADRGKMLRGEAADEQCEIVNGVNFLNAADIDGRRQPPPNMPEIVMAAGGTQLRGNLEDNDIYAWRYRVDWADPAKTSLTGPQKIAVAPYHYLCTGQLSRCVPQPGTDVRLDSQGDKLMQRLAYRNFGSYQAVVATHSVDTRAGGGVRWYQFRLNANGTPRLYQQGTYAPDGGYRWMGSIAMDRRGDIGVGFSYGSATNYVGQRFAARLAGDPKGEMTLHEAVLARGQAAQTDTLRWEDYTTLDIDPSDGCTFWYVGDYLKRGAPNYSTRIGGFRLPRCTAQHKFLGLF